MQVGIVNPAPDALRRNCASFCHAAGGEPKQIQFLPGNVSAQTSGRYLACKQRIRYAARDCIGIGPKT